jgi:hypothetical protein
MLDTGVSLNVIKKEQGDVKEMEHLRVAFRPQMS